MASGVILDSAFLVREYHVGDDCPMISQFPAQEIHVWKCCMDRSTEPISELRSTLSPDELERARRYRFDDDRNEFIITRGTLRILLGAYLSVRPTDLGFTYTEYGRPAIVSPTLKAPLDFNVSQSTGVSLLAFSRGCRVGIDVERVRSDFETSEIAERFFSLAEREALRKLPPGQRHQAFFRCWTRKEAFIKALGEGLSHPLDGFDVSLAPDEPAALLATRPDARDAARWVLCNIAVPNDYAAALAVELPPANHSAMG